MIAREGAGTGKGRRVTPAEPTVLLVNPAARRGAADFPALRAQLAGRLNLVDAGVPDTPERLLERVEHALGQGVRRVIVAGGDGTLSVAGGRLQGTGAALGVVPWGSGNTFACGLGLPGRLPDLLDVLAQGQVHAFDVGWVEDADGAARVFLNTVTLGVSQRLAAFLTPGVKRRLGWLAWPFAIRRALRSTPRVGVRLSYADGTVDAFATRQLIVANGRSLAGPLPATPWASGEDGRLEVFSLGGFGRLAALAVLGRHVHDPESHYRICRSVAVACTPPSSLDVDGDVWGRTPVTCRVLPGALDVLVPPRAGT